MQYVAYLFCMWNYLLKNRPVFWQGKALDLWTIPHTISGLLIAYGFLQFGINPWIGFFANLSIALAWEWFEKITDLSKTEPRLNGVLDVVMAQAGYVLGFVLFEVYSGTSPEVLIVIASSAVFFIVSALGWISHHLYAE